METVMITIRDEKGSFVYDLELPYDLEAAPLSASIAEALIHYNHRLPLTGKETLYVPRVHRKLQPDETLGQAGVRNGDYIVLTR